MPEVASSNLLDAARDYRRRGWMPVPIPAGQKGPVIPGWQNLRFGEDDLPAHFSGDANIGLLLGEPSGWLVDVDLDCDEAREMVDQFLPATPAVSGRPSSPRSHYWYIAPGAQTKQYRDPKTRDSIAEERSTGGQTVVGPSTHPSGEPYDMLTGEPARVEAAHLATCVASLAEAVVRQRHPDLARESQRGPASSPVGGNGCLGPASDAVIRRAGAYLDAMTPR